MATLWVFDDCELAVGFVISILYLTCLSLVFILYYVVLFNVKLFPYTFLLLFSFLNHGLTDRISPSSSYSTLLYSFACILLYPTLTPSLPHYPPLYTPHIHTYVYTHTYTHSNMMDAVPPTHSSYGFGS